MKLKTCYSFSEIEDLLIKFQKKHRIAARMISDLIIDRDNWQDDALAFKAQYHKYEEKYRLLGKEYEYQNMKINQLERNCSHNWQVADQKDKEIIRLKGKIEAYEKILKI
jgi:allophanate hydrolase subunit 2